MPSRCFINIIAFIVVTVFFFSLIISQAIYMEQKFSCEKIIIFSGVEGKKFLYSVYLLWYLLFLFLIQMSVQHLWFNNYAFFTVRLPTFTTNLLMWLMQEMHVRHEWNISRAFLFFSSSSPSSHHWRLTTI